MYITNNNKNNFFSFTGEKMKEPSPSHSHLHHKILTSVFISILAGFRIRSSRTMLLGK